MRPIKVIDESSRYLIAIADSIYRLGNQFSVDKNDRYLLEQYADELMDIQRKLESIKNNWVMKQQMEKEEDKIKEKI